MKYKNSDNQTNVGNKKGRLNFPKIISIIGPKKSGKTTLIESIGYYFNKNFNQNQKGPFLIHNENKEDFILIESPLDILSISNLTKVSDIIILVIDGFFGLELETFETISFINSNGTPHVFCVLTHLDLYTNWKNLKKSKKRIKSRLKKEIGSQTKLFYLSGISFNQKYILREISNITRYFCLVKIRASLMQTKSSYFLCTRLTVIQKNRQEHLFLKGYLRGKKVKKSVEVETVSPGLGILEKTRFINMKKVVNARGIHQNRKTGKINKKSLLEKGFENFVQFEKKKNINVSQVVFYFLFNLDVIKKSIFRSKYEKFYESSKLRFQDYSFKKKKDCFLQRYGKSEKKSRKWLSIKDNKSTTKIKSKENNILKDSSQTKQTSEYLMNLSCTLAIKKFSKNFLKWFDSSYPLVLNFQNNRGSGNLIEGKVLRHKWNKKIIRSREKIFLSVGWNFFKTSVYFFSIKNKKKPILNKSLKKNGFNLICFRSLKTFEKTGIVGIYNPLSNFSNKSKGVLFNIIFTGYFMGPISEKKIFKKIKIKGQVFNIKKKTAFVKNIFSNEIEVYRFLGNFIFGENKQKGIIRKPSKIGPAGSFRAIFNNNIKRKELVFFRLYVPLKLNDKIRLVDFLINSWDKREIQRKLT